MSNVRLNENSQTKEKLMALINSVNGYLNGYLKYYYAKVIDKQVYKQDLPYHNGKFFRFEAGNDRNSELTGKRVVNMLELRDKLINILSSLDKDLKESKDINAFQLDTLKKMEYLIIQHKITNQKLSVEHGKNHCSYLDNRNMGYGIIYSWWNKSWTQSNADRVLDYSLSAIHDFTVANNIQKPSQTLN